MAAYTYKAATPDGKIVEGTVEASDHGAVALKLQDMGLFPMKVGIAGRASLLSRDVEWPWKIRRVRRKHLLVFTQELHTLVRSGFPLDRSLSVLHGALRDDGVHSAAHRAVGRMVGVAQLAEH